MLVIVLCTACFFKFKIIKKLYPPPIFRFGPSTLIALAPALATRKPIQNLNRALRII